MIRYFERWSLVFRGLAVKVQFKKIKESRRMEGDTVSCPTALYNHQTFCPLLLT